MFNDAQILKDFNVYVNGVGHAGVAEDFIPPKVVFKTVDHDAGGIAGTIEIPTNLDKLETSFTMAKMDPATMSLVGFTHNAGHIITFRGSAKEGLLEKPVVAIIGGTIKEIELEWKKGEKILSKFSMAVTSYFLTVGGREIYGIDKPADIVRIGGTDINAVTRANTGI